MRTMKHKNNASKTKTTPSKAAKFVSQIQKQENRPAVVTTIRYSRVASSVPPKASRSERYYHYGVQ